MLDWNDLHSFLELSRCGKLTLAARRLKVEPTTISRRVTRLEEELNTHLFDRSPKGYALTEEGAQLLPHAEKIDSELNLVHQKFSTSNLKLTGTVRIASPEALGVGILSKHVKEFHSLYPEIELELLADTRVRSISKREADISIVLERPKSNRLVTWKLGKFRLSLYGSRDYLKPHSKIKTIKDLYEHPFISFIDDLIEHPQLRYLIDVLEAPNIIFRSNSFQSQYQSISDGMGLGFLHDFLAAKDKALKSVLENEIFITREYWMIVHKDIRHLSRISAVSRFFTDKIKMNNND